MSSIKLPSRLLREFLIKGIGRSKRVLDIGCGEGTTAFYLASTLNCRIDSIDLDKGKIHRAKEKFKNGLPKGIVLCSMCDSRRMNEKFKDNTFDAVIIIHALHHLPDLDEILSKTRIVLKHGGKIFISEYQRDYGEKRDNCPRFSSKKIKLMLKTSNFRDIISHNLDKNLVMITAKKGGKQNETK